MNMPERLKVGPFYIEVHRKPLEGEDLGNYLSRCGLIILSDEKFCSKELELDTFLHELLHGIFDVYNIGMEDEIEEKIVTSMATALVQVFQDNPDLVDYIEGCLRRHYLTDHTPSAGPDEPRPCGPKTP